MPEEEVKTPVQTNGDPVSDAPVETGGEPVSDTKVEENGNPVAPVDDGDEEATEPVELATAENTDPDAPPPAQVAPATA